MDTLKLPLPRINQFAKRLPVDLVGYNICPYNTSLRPSPERIFFNWKFPEEQRFYSGFIPITHCDIFRELIWQDLYEKKNGHA